MRTVFGSSKTIAAIVALCFVAYVSRAADSTVSNECHLKRLASIDLAIRGDVVLLPVTINDHMAWMQLDTANIASLLGTDGAKGLNVSVQSLPRSAEVDMGKSRITEVARPASFSLGPVKIEKPELLLSPYVRSTSLVSGKPIVGILGLDMLWSVDFELDFANSKLNLYSQDHCPGTVVYWTDNYSSAKIMRGPMGNYYFPLELDGKRIEATISTAYAANAITVDATKRLYGFDEKSEGIETEQDPQGRSESHYRAMTITGQGIKITNARMRIVTTTVRGCYLTSSGGVAIYAGCMGGGRLH